MLCTVRLARRVLTRDEAPSVRLSALAQLFGASTTPDHRALDDARATVDVLHALFERVGNQGVHTFPTCGRTCPTSPRRSAATGTWPPDLPRRPGVYLFRGPADEVLYVGTAVDLRRRVASTSTAPTRARGSRRWSRWPRAVDHVECAHDLEAGVRELRLLAAHAPPYNRRSKFPHRWWWVVLTDEAFPRFSVVRDPEARPRGRPVPRPAPTPSTRRPCWPGSPGVRTCTTRLARSAPHGPSCPERELSPCPAPRGVTAADYADAPRRRRRR